MASFLNSFIGNPFSTPVGQTIEKATNTSVENWSLYMELCDQINSSEEGPRDAIRAFKKQLANFPGKYEIFMTTLTVLETCVKNCGHRFHFHLAQKDFIQEFIKILTQKATPPVLAVDRVLGLLQTWADAFQGSAELKEVENTVRELKQKGFEFPVEDVEHAPPIHTPARKTLPPTSLPTHQPNSLLPPHSTSNSINSSIVSTGATEVNSARQSEGKIQKGGFFIDGNQMIKLRGELKVVLQNCKVFNEMITENTPGSESQEDWKLMKELEATNRECHKRLVDLISQYTIEQLTGEIIPVNDEVTNVLLRFERYQRLKEGPSDPNRQNGQNNQQDLLIEISEDSPAIQTGKSGPLVAENNFQPALSSSPKQQDLLDNKPLIPSGTDNFKNFAGSGEDKKASNPESFSDELKSLGITQEQPLPVNTMASSEDFENFLASHETKTFQGLQGPASNIPTKNIINSNQSSKNINSDIINREGENSGAGNDNKGCDEKLITG